MGYERITPMETEAGSSVRGLFQLGRSCGWHNFIGCSASRWLGPQDIATCQSYLDWNAEYRTIDGVAVPSLARECFVFSQQVGVRYESGKSPEQSSFLVLQIDDSGSKYRILWEGVEDHHPPMELNIQLVMHASRKIGPGNVVYHCQPLNILALAAIDRKRNVDLLDDLSGGYAAIHNVIPDGIESVPWGMKEPIRREMRMSPSMQRDMRAFISKIGEHARACSTILLEGEGLLCSSWSAENVFCIINTLEHSAEIRLKMLAAGIE